jgi:hypothetical protein
LEELLYWGAILAFYLWSAYRSNQKKAQQIKPQQAPLKKELDNPQIPNNSKINILDFLNEAFEEQSKAISVQNTVDRSSKKGDQSIKDTSKNHFDNNQDLSVIDNRHLENHKIKDQHLDMIKSRLNHKQVLTKSKKKQQYISTGSKKIY